MITPLFSSYIPINTASFHASSSLGPFTVGTIDSNLEWQRYFRNTTVDACQTGYATFTTLSNPTTFLMSYTAPFRISLDSNGNPNPLLCMISPSIQGPISQSGTSITMSYQVLLKTYTQFGNVSALELGEVFFSGSNGSLPQETSYKWYGLQTPSSSFGVTSSVLQTQYQVTRPYDIAVRSTKSLSSTDGSMSMGLAQIEVYFKLYNFTYSGGVPPLYGVALYGLHAHEVGQ